MSTTAVASSWGTIALRDCCDIVAGSTPSREVAQFWDGPIPWATPKDLSDLDSPVLENTPEGITQRTCRVGRHCGGAGGTMPASDRSLWRVQHP